MSKMEYEAVFAGRIVKGDVLVTIQHGDKRAGHKVVLVDNTNPTVTIHTATGWDHEFSVEDEVYRKKL